MSVIFLIVLGCGGAVIVAAGLALLGWWAWSDGHQPNTRS